MVGLTRLNLSSQLARYLRGHPAVILPRQARTQASVTHHPRRWRLRDRLSEQDIAELVAAFKAGAAKHELAARYGIGMKSVKKILRQYGVKKRSRYEGRM